MNLDREEMIILGVFVLALGVTVFALVTENVQ